MNKIHAKSPCCHGKIIKFGSRRRQCIICRKTWTIRQRKKGRKKKRVNHSLLVRYLNKEITSLNSLYHRSPEKTAQMSYRLRQSLVDYMSRPWPIIPKGEDLIVIADAMFKRHLGKSYTVYFILIKEVASQNAIIVKPYILAGKESALGWKRAFAKLPKRTSSSIKVMVSDGHKGILKIARQHDWLIQRCHFHLISSFQGRRSKSKYSFHRNEGRLLYRATIKAITTTDEKILRKSLETIRQIATTAASPRFRYMLNGFLKDYERFRTYLKYPKLNIPKTSNSAESLVSGARELCSRAKGFKTMKSVKLWIYAYAKNKKTIVCNGAYQQN